MPRQKNRWPPDDVTLSIIQPTRRYLEQLVDTKRRNVTYQELAEKLAEIGVKETPAAIANKISRGAFTAVFFVQCLVAAGCQSLRLTE